ncbi:hypothetical protein J5N97_014720 [Dioscorea zingiberensis]|uniref:Alpha-ketoglutarate-dependent dioxygenase AlkB-like domain-containing protein n=1 Tax=Dioscorea zingiberensis TaxID=325984 RepID=A0A9D5HJZ6_9LILI|nr:hypothetical protein J5N97_014720 [Dioscorea zingiberensis]
MGERSSGGRFPARRGQAHAGSRWVPVVNSCTGQESGGSVLTGAGDRNKSPQSVTMPQQRPSYRNDAKLHLQMMCLGKNWDPEAKYVELRPTDGAKPPEIPEEFRKLVKGSIQASHDFLLHQNKDINVEDELPKISPDICIVNFYNENGRLGLHQGRDESPESLAKGFSVVSFSVGNSAEFLYGLGDDYVPIICNLLHCLCRSKIGCSLKPERNVRVQVDDEDEYYDCPPQCEYETDDSNAEDNPLNEYLEEKEKDLLDFLSDTDSQYDWKWGYR